MANEPSMRIGRLAELVGVSSDVLRVWERRYGLFEPERTPGGYRLYSEADLDLARRVLALREKGVPISAAVSAVTQGRPIRSASAEQGLRLRRELDSAAVEFDEFAFVSVLDRAIDEFGVANTIHDILMPYLQQVGTEWEAGRISVAQEHFVSHIVRRRVGALARLVDDADAPIAVLACPPKELHDIPLLALGVLMSDAGWRVRYLGSNTPLKDLYGACERLDPDLIIMSGTRRTVFEARAGALRRLSQRWPMAIGGRGATPSVAAVIGADRLPEHLRDSAEFLLTSRDQYRRPAAGQ